MLVIHQQHITQILSVYYEKRHKKIQKARAVWHVGCLSNVYLFTLYTYTYSVIVKEETKKRVTLWFY